ALQFLRPALVAAARELALALERVRGVDERLSADVAHLTQRILALRERNGEHDDIAPVRQLLHAIGLLAHGLYLVAGARQPLREGRADVPVADHRHFVSHAGCTEHERPRWGASAWPLRKEAGSG